MEKTDGRMEGRTDIIDPFFIRSFQRNYVKIKKDHIDIYLHKGTHSVSALNSPYARQECISGAFISEEKLVFDFVSD